MKLLYAPTSAFVRKVMVTAHETGQQDDIQSVITGASPFAPNHQLNQANPLGKIPVLEVDGETVFDSRVICEFLDARSRGAHVFPPPGPSRWLALTQQALADGMVDAALAARYETQRPEQARWQGWRDAQLGKVSRAIDRMAAMIPTELTIGAISFGCGLGYIDFRYPGLAWRDTQPTLADWLSTFSRRPSMLATVPRDV